MGRDVMTGKDAMIIDLHNDLFTCGKSNAEIINCVNSAKNAGALVLYAVYNDGKRDFCFLAEKAAKIKNASGGNCTLENACYLNENADNGLIDRLFELIAQIKPLFVSLCHNDKNAFAGGCKSEGGITELGKTFIKFLNERKIPLDLSHINEQGFYEGVELSFKPLCSHSALYSLCEHPRNLKNEQISALLEKGGVMGLIGVNHFLKTENLSGESAFNRHIDGYLQKFGTKGLCLGSDFFGSDAPVFSDGDYDAFSRTGAFLDDMGLNETEREKVLFKNAAEFLNIENTFAFKNSSL